MLLFDYGLLKKIIVALDGGAGLADSKLIMPNSRKRKLFLDLNI